MFTVVVGQMDPKMFRFILRFSRTFERNWRPRFPNGCALCIERTFVDSAPKYAALENSIMNVFDRKTKRKQRNRTALYPNYEIYDYLKEEVSSNFRHFLCIDFDALAWGAFIISVWFDFHPWFLFAAISLECYCQCEWTEIWAHGYYCKGTWLESKPRECDHFYLSP